MRPWFTLIPSLNSAPPPVILSQDAVESSAEGYRLLSTAPHTTKYDRRIAWAEGWIATELTLVLLAAPPATAGAVCLDKARGTLDHILATDLSDAEIVLGKLGVHVSSVLGLVLSYGAVIASLGLTLATWVSRLGRAVALLRRQLRRLLDRMDDSSRSGFQPQFLASLSIDG